MAPSLSLFRDLVSGTFLIGVYHTLKRPLVNNRQGQFVGFGNVTVCIIYLDSQPVVNVSAVSWVGVGAIQIPKFLNLYVVFIEFLLLQMRRWP
jgi:hypothetical protein